MGAAIESLARQGVVEPTFGAVMCSGAFVRE